MSSRTMNHCGLSCFTEPPTTNADIRIAAETAWDTKYTPSARAWPEGARFATVFWQVGFFKPIDALKPLLRI